MRVAQLVVDAVAAEDDEVVVVLDLEAFNVRRGDDNFRVALVFRSLGFNVAKRTRDRESAWEDTVRTQEDLLAHLARLTVLVLHFRH